MLILKQNAANTVPTPPAGKGTIFLDDSDTLSVKTSDGNVENFPTVAASNSQVVFMNGTSLSGDAELTYNFNTNVLTVTGNVAAGNLLTNNLLYANGTAWDLSDPGGSNTEIQFNDDESFGGSAAFTFNKSTNTVSIGNTLSVTGNASAGNVNAGNLLTANFVTGTLTTAAQPNITSVGTLTDLNVSGNTIIGGNLTVNGNVVYVNVETLDVEDPVIVLGGGPNGAAPVSDDGKDRGTQLQYYSGSAKNAFMGWDNSNSEFGMGSVVTVTNDVVTFTTYGNLRVGNIIGNGQALTGINGANVTGTVANATHASTANTVVDAAQPNITSVGTLSSLSVTGNTTSNNFNATTYVTASSIYANTGTVGANYVTAAVDVTATRDVLAGNVFANLGIIGGNTGNFSANVSAGGVKTDNLYYANGTPWDLSDPGGSNTQIQFNDDESFGGSAAFTFDKSSNLVSVSANLNANNLNATTHVTAGNVWANTGTVGGSLLTGTLTTASQPNVTSLGTLSSLSVTGNAGANNFNATTHVTAGNVYANSGTVGASLLTGTLTTASQPNVTSVGTLSSLSVTGNVSAGNVYSNSGTIGASLLTGTLTTASQPNVTSVGNLANLTIAANGNITMSGAGATLSGANLVSATLLTGTLTTASQPNVTSLGTLTGLGVNGNITAANFTANTGIFTGNAAGLTNIPGGNITGNITGNISNAAHAVTANTVVDAAQPNITSVGTLTSLAVTGNTSSGNFNTAGKVVASTFESNVADGTAPMVVVSTTKVANLNADLLDGYSTATAATANTVVIRDSNGSFSANVVTASLSGAATTAGTVTTAAQPNITSVGTLTSLAVTGNASAGNVSATGDISGATLTGTLTTASQPNITSVGTLSSLTVTGNASAGNISTVGVLSVTGNANVGNIGATNGVFTNVSGNGAALTALPGGNVTGQVANALVSGTVYTAAQPNITSVGTLTGLAVNGNITAANITANTGVFTGNGSGLSALAGANVTGQVANALVAGTVYTAAQPNITSVGTLSSLAVTGNASAGNISTVGVLSVTGNANVGNLGTAGLITATGNVSGGNLTTGGAVVATGNVSGGNLTTAGALSVTGNANTGNLGTTTLIATTGNITTINSGLLQNGNSNIAITANGNVSIQAAGSTVELVVTSTGANISGTLNATGNANVGNLGTAGLIVATGNVTGGNLTTAGVLSVTGNANVGNIGGGSGVFTGTVSATGNVSGGNLTTTGILSVTGTGTSSIAGNLDMTSNNITNLASPVNSTDAATKQYVDDVAQGLHTHDSCNAATDGTLATISGGTVTYNNGSSGVGATLTTTGSYTTIDGVTLQNGMRILVKNEANAAHNGIYDRTSSTVLTRSSDFDTPTEMAGGDFTFVNGGTLYDNTGWVMPDPVTTVGTTAVNWVQFSGAGTYTAGTGLTLTGTVFSVNASQTQITSVGTLGSLTVSGNASAGNISTGGALSVTGNANVGNIGATNGVFTSVSGNGSALTALDASNISTGTLAQARLANSTLTLGNTTLTLGATTTTVAGLTSVTSTTFVGALTGAATTAGTVTTAAQPNITSVGTLTGLGVNGNITAANITANTGVFTGNGSGLSALAGANVTGTVSSATTAGTVTTAAQPNITSVGTLTGLGVNGNITAANITANTGVFTGNGSGLSALAGANVTGTVSSATTAGTVTTAAQPNITSVGTLSSLSVTGNVSAGNVSGTLLTGTLATAAQPNITSVGSLTGLTLAANADITMSGTGSNINGVALVSATLFEGSGANLTTLNGSNISSGTIAQARLANASVTLGSTALTLGSTVTTVAGLSSVTSTTFVGALTGAATTAGTVTTAAQPNITSVSSSFTSLTFANAQTITGNNITFSTGANTNAGTLTGNFTLSTGSRLQATYADLAEKYLADAHYEEGTVLIFGGDQEVTISTEYDSHRVAGVVSHNAAYVMNAKLEGEHVIDLALTGRVPVKVHGPVVKGDLMVTGPNGHAVANNQARAGTILGKALQNFEGGSGIIEVVVGRV